MKLPAFCRKIRFLYDNTKKKPLSFNRYESLSFCDHFKVVRVLAPLPEVVRILWMHADTRELRMILEKQHRNKIAIVHGQHHEILSTLSPQTPNK
jgi:hypothetical protein